MTSTGSTTESQRDRHRNRRAYVMRPILQVTHVETEMNSGTEPRLDTVTVTLHLSRTMATRAVPQHMVDIEVFNAIGEWWDAQIEYEEEPERVLR